MTPYAELRALARTLGRCNLEDDPGTPRIDEIMLEYAHGQCHALTAAVLESSGDPRNTRFFLLLDARMDAPIHSCVPVGTDPASGETLVFDAYGLVTPRDLEIRYGHHGTFRFDDTFDYDELLDIAGPRIGQLPDARDALSELLIALRQRTTEKDPDR